MLIALPTRDQSQDSLVLIVLPTRDQPQDSLVLLVELLNSLYQEVLVLIVQSTVMAVHLQLLINAQSVNRISP